MTGENPPIDGLIDHIGAHRPTVPYIVLYFLEALLSPLGKDTFFQRAPRVGEGAAAQESVVRCILGPAEGAAPQFRVLPVEAGGEIAAA